MQIVITGSAFDTGVSIKNHIKEKLDTISKKLKSGKLHKIHAVLNKDGINFLCKIDVVEEIGGKTILHASHEATAPYPCVDFAIKKIEDQIIKYKEKVLQARKIEEIPLTSSPIEEIFEIIGETDADADDLITNIEKDESNKF